MSDFWHSASPNTPISLDIPLSYADRLRIRQPGDAAFALGPHIDGGSVERWMKEGYGRGHVYDKVFEGKWESYDPWEASGRVDAVNDLHNGLGACSAFRAWQGWVSMSKVGPEEGTLLTYPLMLSTAYTLLRPFFRPIDTSKVGDRFLDEKNWAFTGEDDMTSDLQGAFPGHGQELNDELHPHLELSKTMTHVPEIKPGAFVAWHCDSKLSFLTLPSTLNFVQYTYWCYSYSRRGQSSQRSFRLKRPLHSRLPSDRAQCPVSSKTAPGFLVRHTRT